MSTATRTFERPRISVLRGAALVAALVVVGSYLSAMYFVVDVVGDPDELLLVAAGALAAATVCSRLLAVRRAVALSTGLLAVGMGWYLTTLPANAFAIGPHMEYVIALLSGHSVLEIVNLKQWVLAVAPGPVFLTWYLALRRRYVASAVVGGGTVGFFVLTGDATVLVALVGAVAALAVVGLGELERAAAAPVDAEVVSIVLAVVVVTSLTVSLVPQGAAMQYSPETGFASAEASENTVEASLLSDTGRLRIQGSIELSPKVRWTVESPRSDYWRVGTFDLYTGDGWIRRGGSTDTGGLDDPPGPSRRLEQTFTAESAIQTLPAAWRPVSVSGPAADAARATEFGSLLPSRGLTAGESYTVTSRVPIATGSRLQEAGTDYPEAIESRYTQLPDSTPDRVGDRTARLTANARTPYETALTVERWLENNREYSLDVPAPGDNVADEFLFERQQGYCVYYATTMAVMLRTQGIPARMVTGYSTGEQVEDDTWVVRGYNSHAWVEAYFPEVGWVRFDPTPDGPRDSIRSGTLDTARQNNVSGVDTDATEDSGFTTPGVGEVPTPNGTAPWFNGSNGTTTPVTTPTTPDSDPNDTVTRRLTAPSGRSGGGGDGGSDSLDSGRDLPNREEVFLGLVAMVGFVAAVRRSGASGRLYRSVWLRWQPRDDPETDIERAYERLEALLAERHRERDPGETTRQYLRAVDADERALEVARIRERARYAGTATEADADRAIELVDELLEAA